MFLTTEPLGSRNLLLLPIIVTLSTVCVWHQDGGSGPGGGVMGPTRSWQQTHLLKGRTELHSRLYEFRCWPGKLFLIKALGNSWGRGFAETQAFSSLERGCPTLRFILALAPSPRSTSMEHPPGSLTHSALLLQDHRSGFPSPPLSPTVPPLPPSVFTLHPCMGHQLLS